VVALPGEGETATPQQHEDEKRQR